MTALLQTDNLCVNYGAIKVLRDVNIEINAGEIVTLIGANGAGKTTLLMSIFGTPRRASGRILFDNEDISGALTHTIASRGIALVPEGRRIFGKMTVEENLQMGTISLKDPAAGEDIQRIYQLFPRLLERRNQRAGTMSGGEQQMLAIGRALMCKPRLLLLDEPSLGLAPLIIQEIFKTLKEIAEKGTTIFLVEQNARKALQLANRGYVLMSGEIHLEGRSSDLIANPKIQELYLGH